MRGPFSIGRPSKLCYDGRMLATPHSLQPPVERAVEGLSQHFRFRPMFGGFMGYADDRPFASFSNIGLALKLATADQEELLKIKGAKMLQYAPTEPVSKQYVVLPESIINEKKDLTAWIKRSVAHVAQQKTVPKKKPGKR